MRGKKGELSNEQMVYLGIGLLVFFVAAVIIWKMRGTLSESIPMCNDNVMKCACFFTTETCPGGSLPKYESKMCPPDNTRCVDVASYKQGLDAASKTKKFGTCCQGDMTSVSKTRLKTP